MKRPIPLLVLFLAAIAWAKEPPTTQAISNTRYGMRKIYFSGTSAQGLDFNQFSDVLQRQVNRLAMSLLNAPGDVMHAENVLYGDHIEVTLIVDLKDRADAKPAAKEFLDQVIASADEEAGKAFDASRDKELALAARERDEAMRQADNATHQAKELRTRMREIAGRADVSTEGVTSAVSKLEEEKQKLELDVMGKRARREALEKQVAEQAAKVEAMTEKDPVVAELKQVVKVREEKVEQVKKLSANGTVSVTEVNDAIAAAAEARARMLERGKAAAAESGGDMLASLNHEIVNLSVDLRELEARLELVEKRLPGLRQAMDDLDSLQRAEADLKSARDEMSASSARMRETSRRLEATDRPHVIVRESDNRAEAPAGAGELFPTR